MLAADWHTCHLLTKCPERMLELVRGPLCAAAQAGRILWGVSVENRRYVAAQIRKLKKAKVGNSFLSVEPLLEDIGIIDLREISWVPSVLSRK